MTLVAKPEGREIVCHVSFAEPIFNPFEDKHFMPLLTRINKDFGVRLNDITINKGALSDGILAFSVFEGRTWFRVSYGVEEVTASMVHPQSEEQVARLYFTLSEYFRTHKLGRQQITFRYHLSLETDAIEYLRSLNPDIPPGFEAELESSGVSYALRIPEDELSIYISLSASLLVDGGLYFTIDYDFAPSIHDFSGALKVAEERLNFVQGALGMNIKAGEGE